MPTKTPDPKTKLAELAKEHAALAAKKDKASRFRCRMIAERAKSLIRQLHKSKAAQDAAFEKWQKQATADNSLAAFWNS